MGCCLTWKTVEMNKIDASMTFGTFEHPPEQYNLVFRNFWPEKHQFLSARFRQWNSGVDLATLDEGPTSESLVTGSTQKKKSAMD